jgi:carbon monoxide dehydrogenase subunit G
VLNYLNILELLKPEWMKELKIKNTIDIEVPACVLWDILTNPEKTKIYMFGCEAVSDWKIGSELLWRGKL